MCMAKPSEKTLYELRGPMTTTRMTRRIQDEGLGFRVQGSGFRV